MIDELRAIRANLCNTVRWMGSLDDVMFLIKDVRKNRPELEGATKVVISILELMEEQEINNLRSALERYEKAKAMVEQAKVQA